MRKRWLIAIRRERWQPNETSVVCRRHFKHSDYKDENEAGKCMYCSFTISLLLLVSLMFGNGTLRYQPFADGRCIEAILQKWVPYSQRYLY